MNGGYVRIGKISRSIPRYNTVQYYISLHSLTPCQHRVTTYLLSPTGVRWILQRKAAAGSSKISAGRRSKKIASAYDPESGTCSAGTPGRRGEKVIVVGRGTRGNPKYLCIIHLIDIFLLSFSVYLPYLTRMMYTNTDLFCTVAYSYNAEKPERYYKTRITIMSSTLKTYILAIVAVCCLKQKDTY